MTIEIKCRAADVLPIDRILEFQGALKKLPKKSLEKLKTRIATDGFIAPFFVWENAGDYMLLDGHQRLAALLSLREDGYDMPLFPVAFVEADDEAQARARLLSITSQYGEFDLEELQSWIDEIDDDIADTLRFTDDAVKLDLGDIDDDSGPEEDKEPDPSDTVKLTVTGITRERAESIMIDLLREGCVVKVS